MNYQQARIFLITTIIIAVLLIGGTILRQLFSPTAPAAEGDEETDEKIELQLPQSDFKINNLHISKKVGNLARQFTDLNEAHLTYARRIGIRPIRSTQDIMRLNHAIVHVKSCNNYKVDRLTHSYPYLVPGAAELLDSIGARFNRKLAERSGGHYRIKVTSLLRTEESVRRLKKGNVNSTSNSAHLYGTTFDISYVDFDEAMLNTRKLNDGQLKNLLAEVLLDLREEGKCLVKYERKQGCFHITATGK